MPEQVVELYVFNHKIAERLTSAVNEILKTRPDEPFVAIVRPCPDHATAGCATRARGQL